MHNSIRNGLQELLKKACMVVKLTSSEAIAEHEYSHVITKLPTLCLFDITVTFNHMLDEDVWRSDLKTLGIDITIVLPALNFDSVVSQAARSKELFSCLREGEKKKCVVTGRLTSKVLFPKYSGDEIMGLIERDNMVLIPVFITPRDNTGPLFNHLLYDHDTKPHGNF